MLKIKTIKIKNFLSFGNKETVVNLDTNNTTMILGNNADIGADGYSRNGAGKSSIFQAICWGLFNEGIGSIKQDEFINFTNKKGMLVTIELEKDGIDYVIKRGRKPGILSVERNGQAFTTHSSDSVDDTIRELVGMDIDIFLNTVLLTTNVESFMAMKPAAQKAFMEKFLSIDLISERVSYLKAELKNVNTDITIEESKKDMHLSNVQRTKNKISTLEENSRQFLQTKEADLARLDKDIERYSSINVDAELYTIELNDQMRERSNEINGMIRDIKTESDQKISSLESNASKEIADINLKRSEKKAKLNSEFSSKTAEIERERTESMQIVVEHKMKLAAIDKQIGMVSNRVSQIDKEKEKLNKELKALDHGVCPYCSQNYTSEEKVQEINDTLKTLNEEFEDLSADSANLFDDEEIFKKAIADTTKIVDDKYRESMSEATKKNAAAISTVDSDYDDMVADVSTTMYNEKSLMQHERQAQIADLMLVLEQDCSLLPEPHSRNELMEVKDTIIRLSEERKFVEARENHNIRQIEDLKNDITEYDYSVLDALRKNADHHSMLIKLLSDSKSFVRKNIIDQYIPFINQRVTEYLGALDSGHRMKINNDLSVDIEYMGNTVSYGTMSNGERMRVNLSVNLAFGDLLAATSRKANLFLVDELLDNGGDPNFFHKVFKVITDKKTASGSSVFIISHRDELLTSVDTVMTVVKRGGFSRIEEKRV